MSSMHQVTPPQHPNDRIDQDSLNTTRPSVLFIRRYDVALSYGKVSGTHSGCDADDATRPVSADSTWW